MDKLIAKARVLLEALPYMQRFSGRTIVIKYGGSAMLDEELQSGFAEDVVLLRSLGLHPVIVHGGGPQIGEALKKHGIPTRFVRGLRVTDEATMEIVEMVLGGRINKDIVTLIHRHRGKAVGLTGKDGAMLRVKKKAPLKLREPGQKTISVDLGRVGTVDQVNPEVLHRIVGTDFVPVIAPIGVDAAGNSYNINADSAAAAIAGALDAEKLILLTDVAGIQDAEGNAQSILHATDARRQIRSESIAGGMVPKVECALSALDQGVRQVHIIDGRVSHAVLLEIFTDRGVGTEVKAGSAPKARRKKSPARKRAGKKRAEKKTSDKKAAATRNTKGSKKKAARKR